MSKTKKDYLFVVLALFIIFSSYFSSGFMGLSADAIKLLAVFVASLILWIFVSIDWPSFITILFLGLIPSLGFNQVFKDAFGNSTVVFLIFTFILFLRLISLNVVLSFLSLIRLQLKGHGFSLPFF